MPGILPHAPSRIIRQLLVDLGLGTLGGETDGDWPVFYSNLPDQPDDCIVIIDDENPVYERHMTDGTRANEFEGYFIRIRSDKYDEGYLKAETIARTLDLKANVYRRLVVVGGVTYRVHSVNRDSDVVPLGKSIDGSKRSLFAVSATSSIKKCD